jgi:hypothetical protein
MRWRDRNHLQGIKSPGVYAIVKSGKDIAARRFSWRKEIVYIGVTISKGGLKSRLQQFDNVIRKGKKGHSGAERFQKSNPDCDKLVHWLYVSISYTECNDLKRSPPAPSDLRLMGKVLRQEYECFAVFVKQFKKWPSSNDKTCLRRND